MEDWTGGLELADCFAIRLFCVVERERAAEWTLKWRGGRRKSKTQVGAQERKARHHICAKIYIKSHKPLALKLTSSRIIQVSNNLHSEVKHWHGAKKDSWFSHIAAEIPGENTSNEWCEPVTDEEYNRLG